MIADSQATRVRTGRLLAQVIDLIDEATEVLSRSGPGSEDLGSARSRLQEAAQTLSRLARWLEDQGGTWVWARIDVPDVERRPDPQAGPGAPR